MKKFFTYLWNRITFKTLTLPVFNSRPGTLDEQIRFDTKIFDTDTIQDFQEIGPRVSPPTEGKETFVAGVERTSDYTLLLLRFDKEGKSLLTLRIADDESVQFNQIYNKDEQKINNDYIGRAIVGDKGQTNGVIQEFVQAIVSKVKPTVASITEEEIEKESIQLHYDVPEHSDAWEDGFKRGAKWAVERLKQK